MAFPVSCTAFQTYGEVLRHFLRVFMTTVVLISLSVRIGAIGKHCLNNKIYHTNWNIGNGNVIRTFIFQY